MNDSVGREDVRARHIRVVDHDRVEVRGDQRALDRLGHEAVGEIRGEDLTREDVVEDQALELGLVPPPR